MEAAECELFLVKEFPVASKYTSMKFLLKSISVWVAVILYTITCTYSYKQTKMFDKEQTHLSLIYSFIFVSSSESYPRKYKKPLNLALLIYFSTHYVETVK